ncbi:hypothetical protein Prudu_022813, partial [Prunus dulcis]
GKELPKSLILLSSPKSRNLFDQNQIPNPKFVPTPSASTSATPYPPRDPCQSSRRRFSEEKSTAILSISCSTTPKAASIRSG